MKNMLGKSGKRTLSLILVMIMSIFFISCADREDSKKYILQNNINNLQSKSTYIKIDDINETFLDAVVATEDRRFYSHGALDFRGVARAIVNNIKAGELREGGSTITQQTAKNLCLNNERSLKRKLKEIMLSFQLEKDYSKKEILELYVNSIYFGSGYTGILEASEGYFNKKPKDLTYDEATLLAGLPQAPSSYDLNTKSGLERARERQKLVEKALEKYNS